MFSEAKRHTRESAHGELRYSPGAMRTLKTAFTILLTLVVAAAVTVGAMIQWSRVSLDRVYDPHGVELVLPTGAAELAAGQRLYRAYRCAECHAEDGGGRALSLDGAGDFTAPNLTAIANAWPVASLEVAIRHGVSPEGRPYLLMPSDAYWTMDDETTARIIAYVRSLPTVTRPLPPSDVRMLGHALHALDAFPLVPADRINHLARRPPPAPIGTEAFGASLARGCTSCHGAHLSGGALPGLDPAVFGDPPNLTPDATGLLAWSEDDFRVAMREGRTPDGRTLDPALMPWEAAYRYLSDDELHSLWLHLVALPPLPAGGR